MMNNSENFYKFEEQKDNIDINENKLFIKKLDKKLKKITAFYKKDKNHIKIIGHIDDNFKFIKDCKYKILLKDINDYIINKLEILKINYEKKEYKICLKELKIFEIINIILNLGKSNIDFDDYFISVYQNISLCYYNLKLNNLSQKYIEKNIYMITKLYNDGKKIVFDQKYGMKYDLFKIKINKILSKNSLFLINLLNIQNNLDESINISNNLIDYCYKIIRSQHYISYYLLIKLEKEKSIREINKNKTGKSYFYSLKDYDYKTKIFQKMANVNICKNLFNFNNNNTKRVMVNNKFKISVLNKKEINYYNFLVRIIPIWDLYYKKSKFIEIFLKKNSKDNRIKYYRQLLQEIVFNKANLTNIFSNYNKEILDKSIEKYYKLEFVTDFNNSINNINIDQLFSEINQNLIWENFMYLSLSLYNNGLVLLKKELFLFNQKLNSMKYSNLYINKFSFYF